MYQRTYLGESIGVSEEHFLWYKLCVYYYAKTEMYDRTLTDLRSPYDLTEAYIDGSVRRYSDAYAIKIRNFVLRIGKELGLHNCKLNDFNHYRYSAQQWIDEYNRLVEYCEMDFIDKFNK